MSILSRFPKEKVRIVKRNSDVIENIDALVSGEIIFIEDATVPIEDGDLVERVIPSGTKEQYLVVDSGFHRGVRGMPDHYQVKVEKQSVYRKMSRGQVNYTYNISHTERVNINSTDNSTNNHYSADDVTLMDSLRSKAHGLDNENELIAAIDRMEESVGTNTFIEKYNAFIQNAANHMTLFAPFIPALTALLPRI